MSCLVDPGCVRWPEPDWDVLVCDPCLDFSDPKQLDLRNHYWSSTVSYLYGVLGRAWPGACWEERIRPCVDQGCGRRNCGCPACGVYESIPLRNATCLPVRELLDVTIAPSCCYPDGATWGVGNGARLEWVSNSPRLVIERVGEGCCGRWPKQDLCAGDGEPGSWSVGLRTGVDPPPHVLDSAGALALQFVAECAKRGCVTGGRVTSASFDGTTVQFDAEGLGPTLPLRLLQDLMDQVGAGTRLTYGAGGPSIVEFHRIGGPSFIEGCVSGC